jgi:hypothetical protein
METARLVDTSGSVETWIIRTLVNVKLAGLASVAAAHADGTVVALLANA